jgi:uncharacterized OB-fold protein
MDSNEVRLVCMSSNPPTKKYQNFFDLEREVNFVEKYKQLLAISPTSYAAKALYFKKRKRFASFSAFAFALLFIISIGTQQCIGSFGLTIGVGIALLGGFLSLLAYFLLDADYDKLLEISILPTITKPLELCAVPTSDTSQCPYCKGEGGWNRHHAYEPPEPGKWIERVRYVYDSSDGGQKPLYTQTYQRGSAGHDAYDEFVTCNNCNGSGYLYGLRTRTIELNSRLSDFNSKLGLINDKMSQINTLLKAEGITEWERIQARVTQEYEVSNGALEQFCCRQCGEIVQPYQKACDKCGRNLDWQQQVSKQNTVLLEESTRRTEEDETQEESSRVYEAWKQAKLSGSEVFAVSKNEKFCCKQCGANVEPYQKSCTNCGRILDWQERVKEKNYFSQERRKKGIFEGELAT